MSARPQPQQAGGRHGRVLSSADLRVTFVANLPWVVRNRVVRMIARVVVRAYVLASIWKTILAPMPGPKRVSGPEVPQQLSCLLHLHNQAEHETLPEGTVDLLIFDCSPHWVDLFSFSFLTRNYNVVRIRVFL